MKTTKKDILMYIDEVIIPVKGGIYRNSINTMEYLIKFRNFINKVEGNNMKIYPMKIYFLINKFMKQTDFLSEDISKWYASRTNYEFVEEYVSEKKDPSIRLSPDRIKDKMTPIEIIRVVYKSIVREYLYEIMEMLDIPTINRYIKSINK